MIPISESESKPGLLGLKSKSESNFKLTLEPESESLATESGSEIEIADSGKFWNLNQNQRYWNLNWNQNQGYRKASTTLRTVIPHIIVTRL